LNSFDLVKGNSPCAGGWNVEWLNFKQLRDQGCRNRRERAVVLSANLDWRLGGKHVAEFFDLCERFAKTEILPTEVGRLFKLVITQIFARDAASLSH
jgi:hypothetical protein